MKLTRQAFTVEFKELAAKRVNGGQSIGMVCKALGVGDQTLRNWVKAAAGRLAGAGAKAVTPMRWNSHGCAPRISGSSRSLKT